MIIARVVSAPVSITGLGVFFASVNGGKFCSSGTRFLSFQAKTTQTAERPVPAVKRTVK
jgi:hypothetical protein